MKSSSHAILYIFPIMPLYRTACYVVITCYTAGRSDKYPRCICETAERSSQCVSWVLEYKEPWSIKYWYFWSYNLEAMLQKLILLFLLYFFFSCLWQSRFLFFSSIHAMVLFVPQWKSCYPTSQCCCTSIRQFKTPTPNPTPINSPCAMATLSATRQ